MMRIPIHVTRSRTAALWALLAVLAQPLAPMAHRWLSDHHDHGGHHAAAAHRHGHPHGDCPTHDDGYGAAQAGESICGESGAAVHVESECAICLLAHKGPSGYLPGPQIAALSAAAARSPAKDHGRRHLTGREQRSESPRAPPALG